MSKTSMQNRETTDGRVLNDGSSVPNCASQCLSAAGFRAHGRGDGIVQTEDGRPWYISITIHDLWR
jgi:hypothetical protein